jgi:murein DD-endopeptidase MepM/ murein hydrolase activator NlpD
MHKGIDFAVPVGTPVMAAGTGTVKIAGHMGGYGNYLRIDMGN